ncbi:MAG: outer membrane lipoprotein-sorting protein [Denitrovibrio sp.]|nr:MAG: outer membrane lipoprotein-sorting protein [Denitrovibrio sp.]
MVRLIVCMFIFLLVPFDSYAVDARDIVERSYNYMRGETSFARVRMRIHRPDYERKMTLNSWSKGRSNALFVITSPKKDSGSGTLKKGRQMWTYNPKINRVIKLPPSMMSQSWMGSDFSNNDLSKTESMIDDYTHEITGAGKNSDQKTFTIVSIPKPDAPVVWGSVQMEIREDGILLAQRFLDQEGVPVKELVTSGIKKMGGKLFPSRWTMINLEEHDRFTEIVYEELQFGIELSDRIFTTTYMKNQR